MSTKKSIINFLFKEKPFKLLLVLSDLKEKNITQIYRKTQTTYSHTLNMLKMLYEMDIIEFEKTGRSKVIRLTKKGEKLIEFIKDFIREFY
ncbi:MAG: winged helix-turn-helix domain-containing protein [Candidatus Aenigmatarchaeota archaeon]